MGCQIHGGFLTTPSDFLYSKSGCPRCFESRGETAVAEYLDSHGIKYIREHKIAGNLFRYDFYLPEQNVFIEFHGEQHYQFNEYFHKTYDEYMVRRNVDECKRELVALHYGKLIVVNYWQLENGTLTDVLAEKLHKLKVI